jgi:hypothetical protein
MAKGKDKEKRTEEGQPRAWLVPAVVVLVGAVLVIYKLASGPSTDESQQGPSSQSTSAAPSAAPPVVDEPHEPGEFAVPIEATCEIGVVTAVTGDELDRATKDPQILALINPKYCGASCDAVRELVTEAPSPERQFDIEASTTEDWPLPTGTALEHASPTLSSEERRSVAGMRDVLVIHAHERSDSRHVVFRACTTIAAGLADALHGFVYDDVVRRVEPARDFVHHVVVNRPDELAFRPEHVAFERRDEPDGTARIVTFGMVRFGAPDLEARGFDPKDEARVRKLMEDVAAKLASGAHVSPIAVDGIDVALVTSEVHIESDPDNDLVTIVPRTNGGNDASADVTQDPASWKALLNAARRDAQ